MLDVFSFSYVHYRRLTGKWHDVTDRYLGVSFIIGGKTHFGWTRLTVLTRDTQLPPSLPVMPTKRFPISPSLPERQRGQMTTASNNRMILAPVLL